MPGRLGLGFLRPKAPSTRIVDMHPPNAASYTLRTAPLISLPGITGSFGPAFPSRVSPERSIDVTQNTMSAIPMEDYESIEALENVTPVYGDPVTNQSVFIQTANVPDPRVRQAMLCAIDRNRILDQLMKGHGEVIDGFLSSASPYFDASITPVSYDRSAWRPARAPRRMYPTH